MSRRHPPSRQVAAIYPGRYPTKAYGETNEWLRWATLRRSDTGTSDRDPTLLARGNVRIVRVFWPFRIFWPCPNLRIFRKPYAVRKGNDRAYAQGLRQYRPDNSLLALPRFDAQRVEPSAHFLVALSLGNRARFLISHTLKIGDPLRPNIIR